MNYRMISKEIIWFYIDSRNNQQGPFSAFQMAQWMDCGYFKDDLKCKTGQDKYFHTIEEWKWISGTKNPFLSVLESFDSARWKTFPSLSLDYLKFADTEIPLRAQPAVVDLCAERDHCKRLFDSLPETVTRSTKTTPFQGRERKPDYPKTTLVNKRRFLDRSRKGSLIRSPTMRYVKFRSRSNYRTEEIAKDTERSKEQLHTKERPALRLIWHKLCVSTAENPWGKRNNRKKYRTPEEWKPYPTKVPWTVSKSDNRFSIITAGNPQKLRPTPFPTFLTEQIENKTNPNRHILEKEKSKECNTVRTINVSNWPGILSKLSGLKISGSA